MGNGVDPCGAATQSLHVAETLSRALVRDHVLTSKIGDLSDWQQGLSDAGL